MSIGKNYTKESGKNKLSESRGYVKYEQLTTTLMEVIQQVKEKYDEISNFDIRVKL
jgi:hypothetical protein